MGRTALNILYWMVIFISNREQQINEQIRDREVRLIGENGDQLGIVAIDKAQQMAIDANLDLVKIAPQAKPPVCKIMDYGKYKFEAAKREKENRKNQKVVEVKEVRLSPSIDTHDFETKVGSAVKFLKSGSKVKVTVRVPRPRIHHSSLGAELLKRFAEAASEYGTVEKMQSLRAATWRCLWCPRRQRKRTDGLAAQGIFTCRIWEKTGAAV